MATEAATGPALILAERPAAATTRVRVVLDDLIDLVLGRELATRTAMAILPARLALCAIPANNSFAFARASARRCRRVLGGSCDGGAELVRESRRA